MRNKPQTEPVEVLRKDVLFVRQRFAELFAAGYDDLISTMIRAQMPQLTSEQFSATMAAAIIEEFEALDKGKGTFPVQPGPNDV